MRDFTPPDFVAHIDGLMADSPPIDSDIAWIAADARTVVMQPASQ